MFDFLKKKKKPTFTHRILSADEYQLRQDREIAYEMAQDYIRSVKGVMFRYMYWLSEIGKDQTKEEKAHISWIEKRRHELALEEQNLKYENLEINNKIIDVYAKLMKEYFAMPVKSDREIAEKGLPEKYVTTKVDLSEFEQDKGA